MKEKFPNSKKPSHWWVCGKFWNLRGQHNQEEEKEKKTEYAPNRNIQCKCSPDAPVCHQRAGAEQGGADCVLRVRNGPECPEDNLRELM